MRNTAALPLSLLPVGGTLAAAQDAHAPITVVQGSRRGRAENSIVEPHRAGLLPDGRPTMPSIVSRNPEAGVRGRVRDVSGAKRGAPAAA
jgi:hypothetical protein